MLGRIIAEQSKPQVRPMATTKLRNALRQGLERKGNPAPPKAGDWMRASGLPRLCPRMYALAMQKAFSLDTDVDAELGWVFGIGTAIHRQFQEEFLRSLPAQASGNACGMTESFQRLHKMTEECVVVRI